MDPRRPEERGQSEPPGSADLVRVAEVAVPLLYPEDVRGIIEQVLDARLEVLERRIAERLAGTSQPSPSAQGVKVMVSEKDVAQLLGCDRRTVRRLEHSGAIPASFRIGGSKRWRRSDIEQWIASLGCDRSRPATTKG